MTYHIVRINDTLKKIAISYQLDESEIKEVNSYIKDWNHLIPGTKLRLPEISEAINIELDNEDPFIEEYYPRLEQEGFSNLYQEPEIKKEEKIVETAEENITVSPAKKVIKQEMIIPNQSIEVNYNMNYNPYYPYLYYNRNQKTSRRK